MAISGKRRERWIARRRAWGTLAIGAAGAALYAKWARRRRTPAPDAAWFSSTRSRTAPGYTRTSRYIEMRDGVRLAADLYLPRMGSDGRHPTILFQTRYFRRTAWKPFARPLESRLDRRLRGIRRLLAAGYGVAVVDARGSGASFGHRTAEWDADEVADGADVVNWIVSQPWSDGTLGTTGGSYEATCGEQLLRMRHPAVKAAVIQYGLFDLYADIFAPGGVRSSWFIPMWVAMNKASDANERERFLWMNGAGRMKWLSQMLAGVARVDEDADGTLLGQAIEEHQKSYDLVEASRDIQFRDDVRTDGLTLDQFSPHSHLDEIRGSGAAIYSWSTWYDGAYPEAAVKRWLAHRDGGARLILGPWDHGAMQLPDPTTEATAPSFDVGGEIIRYFDHHVRGLPSGVENEPPVWYYTLGSGWSSADTWPPPGFEPFDFFFGPQRSLTRNPPSDDEAWDKYQVDPGATTGNASRWTTLMNIWDRRIGYPDRARQDEKLLTYDSEPLVRDVEVTGHPVLTLVVDSTAADGAFHVYLEEVCLEGTVRYVTEGFFRAIHRRIGNDPPPWHPPVPFHTLLRADAMPLVPGEPAEIAFGLQPVSYRFRAGSRIRVALAGTDRDNFVLIPPEPPVWRVHRSAARASKITLPLKVHND